MSKQIRKPFNEWLTFLKYREVNKGKALCKICKHRHRPDDIWACYMLLPEPNIHIEYVQPQI